ncbi:hypothetical protein F5Y06DRAFT_16559 [Hypoxylon sp. FL0890]|nr:hypothetical protein F5Y06DRAFT_16559 [Hypoxylon sp. FL0890]
MTDNRATPPPSPRDCDRTQSREEIKSVSPPKQPVQKHHLCRCPPGLIRTGNDSTHTTQVPTDCAYCYPQPGVDGSLSLAESPDSNPVNSPQNQHQARAQAQVRAEPQFLSPSQFQLPDDYVQYMAQVLDDRRQNLRMLMYGDQLDFTLHEKEEIHNQFAEWLRNGMRPRAMLYAWAARLEASLRKLLCVWALDVRLQGRDTSAIVRSIQRTTRREEELMKLARAEYESGDAEDSLANREKFQEILQEHKADILRLRETIQCKNYRISNQTSIMRQLNRERNEAQRQVLEQQKLNRRGGKLN